MRRSVVRNISAASSALAIVLAAGAARADTWTVLGYIAADNNLEKYAVKNIVEMTKVGSTGNLNIVLQVSRGLAHSRAEIPGIPNYAGTKRLKVNAGAVEELEDLGSLDGTSPAKASAQGKTPYRKDGAHTSDEPIKDDLEPVVVRDLTMAFTTSS